MDNRFVSWLRMWKMLGTTLAQNLVSTDFDFQIIIINQQKKL
jgi:hypothetical protein